MSADEDGYEELDEDEFSDESDLDDDQPSETVACPECGAEVYEDAVRCPRCGEYILHETRVWAHRPTWWILLGLLGILATIAALTGWLW